MTMISNFMVFFSFKYLFIYFFLQINQIFAFSYDSWCFLVNNSIFFLFKIACPIKNTQQFFIQSLPLYTSCLFSMLLNEDIVQIEKPDEICPLTFVADEFSGLFLHPSIFSIIH